MRVLANAALRAGFGVPALAASLAVLPWVDAGAQTTLTVVGNNLLTPAMPDVADFQANANAGRSEGAGSVSLNITNCPSGKTCSIGISATTVPATGRRLVYTVSNLGTASGSQFGCSAGSTEVQVAVSTVISCTNSHPNQLRNRTGIVVTFGFPVSWSTTPNGSYETSGITFTLTVQ